MSQEMRDKLRLERGVPVFVYDLLTSSLIYVFASKQQLYSSISVHHKTLNSCLDLGTHYAGRFLFSLDEVEYLPSVVLLGLEQLQELVRGVKLSHKKANHFAAKGIVVENVSDAKLSMNFPTITGVAERFGVSRSTIRSYLSEGKLLKGEWRIKKATK